jgi:hypothetical protein
MDPESWTAQRIERRMGEVAREIEVTRLQVLGAAGEDGLAALAAEHAYAFGVTLTLRALEHQGVDVPGAEALAFESLHIPQSRALARELTEGYDGAYSRRLLSERDFYRQVQARAAMVGNLSGETIGETGARLWRRFREEGITSFVDKANRRWRLEAYSAMLARTVTAKACRAAEEAMCAEIGCDLVRIMGGVGSTTCGPCERYNGKTLSLTGHTPGYDTVASAEAAGVFHPNCIHSAVAYVEGARGLSDVALRDLAEQISAEFGDTTESLLEAAA